MASLRPPQWSEATLRSFLGLVLERVRHLDTRKRHLLILRLLNSHTLCVHLVVSHLVDDRDLHQALGSLNEDKLRLLKLRWALDIHLLELWFLPLLILACYLFDFVLHVY